MRPSTTLVKCAFILIRYLGQLRNIAILSLQADATQTRQVGSADCSVPDIGCKVVSATAVVGSE